MARTFQKTDTKNVPAPPLSLGLMGPPGGGKTKSALRIADGIAAVAGGRVKLIDTEAGRALRYLKGAHNPNGHDFDHFPFTPPFKPEDFLTAIRAALADGDAACVIVDSMSDEHEGEGGYLDWHDREVPGAGGNKWAAWAKPSASRRMLVSGFQQIRIPLIFTFRAREKTKQVGTKIVPVGFVPIAPAEILHSLDMTCLLPPRANGVAVWQSSKEGEDFVIKLPEFLAPMITRGDVLTEDLGSALARWQKGGHAAASAGMAEGAGRKRTPEEQVDAYVAGVNACDTLDALRDYQAGDKVHAWIARLKTGRADLHDRVVSANVARANALSPAIDDDQGDDFDFPDDPAVDQPGEEQ